MSTLLHWVTLTNYFPAPTPTTITCHLDSIANSRVIVQVSPPPGPNVLEDLVSQFLIIDWYFECRQSIKFLTNSFIWRHSKHTSIHTEDWLYCFKFLKNISLFMGSLIPLFWTSGDIYPEFQSQGVFPHLYALSPGCNGFLRVTSSGTPTDLLVASIIRPSHFDPHACVQAFIGYEKTLFGQICWLQMPVYTSHYGSASMYWLVSSIMNLCI